MNNKNLLIILYKARDYQKDPDPEHWRTISGAKVHLDNNGEIDGGAGGKLLGKTIEGAWISGHGKQYYFSEANRNKELIANWATIKMVSPRMAEIFRKDKPEVAEQLDRILNFMAKMSGE